MNNKVILVSILTIGLTAAIIMTASQDNQGPTAPKTQDQVKQDVLEGTPAEKKPMDAVSHYQDYSAQAVQTAVNEGKSPVLFFHASWCPTCRTLEKEILEESEQLPDEMVIFKVDYDTNDQLKERYEVSTQHTLVVLDEELAATDRWVGGGLETLLKNYQSPAK